MGRRPGQTQMPPDVLAPFLIAHTARGSPRPACWRPVITREVTREEWAGANTALLGRPRSPTLADQVRRPPVALGRLVCGLRAEASRPHNGARGRVPSVCLRVARGGPRRKVRPCGRTGADSVALLESGHHRAWYFRAEVERAVESAGQRLGARYAPSWRGSRGTGAGCGAASARASTPRRRL